MKDHQQTLAKVKDQVSHAIKRAADERDIDIARCVMLFAVARFVAGPDADRLAEYTGYPKDFVEGVTGRMRAIGLWDENSIVHRKWFDEEGNVTTEIFGDVLVAIGEIECKRTEAGLIEFYDSATGEFWEEDPRPTTSSASEVA